MRIVLLLVLAGGACWGNDALGIWKMNLGRSAFAAERAPRNFTWRIERHAKVLIAGGDVGDGDGASPYAELYDPITGVYTATGSLGTGRETGGAVLLPNGTVYSPGGRGWVPVGNGGYDNFASAEIYDPAAGAFSNTGSMLTGPMR